MWQSSRLHTTLPDKLLRKNFLSALLKSFDDARLISRALKSFHVFGSDIGGCLVVDVNLEKGTKRLRVLRRAGPSCASHLTALVVHVLLKDSGRRSLRNR
jgi:hypothetical protein